MRSRQHRGWIGVDLGTRAVKLAQVERAASGLRLAATRVIARKNSAESEAADSPASWWDEVCRQQTPRQGFAGRQTACVLPGSRTDLRAMTLPEGSEAERRAIIDGELGLLFGATGVPRVFDFWETRRPEDAAGSNLENVNVLSMPEDEAIGVVASLARGGLCCQVFDGLPLALARAVAMISPPDATGPVAAVDWGFQTATFCVIREGRPVFTRQLRDCGFAAISAAVSQGLGLSQDDAEQLLTLYGVYDPQHREEALRNVQDVIVDLATEPIHEMVGQLHRTLSYPELHRSGLVPQTIWLFGGGATVKNIGPYVASRIGLPVQAWELPGPGEAPSSAAPAALFGMAVALSALAWEA